MYDFNTLQNLNKQMFDNELKSEEYRIKNYDFPLLTKYKTIHYYSDWLKVTEYFIFMCFIVQKYSLQSKMILHLKIVFNVTISTFISQNA